MSKISTIHVCSNCNAQSLKWSGRCLECGAWGSLQTQTVDQRDVNYRLGGRSEKITNISPAKVISLDKIKAGEKPRVKTGLAEIDRVLGGGLVPSSVILLAGEPGIGKSTIVAQMAQGVGASKRSGATAPVVVYVSGEESGEQIKSRLERIKVNSENIKFVGETNVEKILATAEEVNPSLLIIDSIQTVYTSLLDSEAGSLNQIRASAVMFLEIAKKKDLIIILIGHITKDGQVAGPKSLEHIVDTVIYLESETTHNYRLLRAAKNRFGSVNELGIFAMTGAGFKEIKNPSAVFIETSEDKITGSVISCIIEGTRPFLVEIQALVTKTVFGYPQRRVSGFDLNRLQVLTAVLTKRAKVNLTNQDVILNVVGGLRINDPALDLAVCLAIASSLLNQVVDRETITLGEVGLGGEVRSVVRLEPRLAAAEKLGFKEALVPDRQIKTRKIKLIKIKNLSDIVKRLI